MYTCTLAGLSLVCIFHFFEFHMFLLSKIYLFNNVYLKHTLMTFDFMAFVWTTKESHMHDIKLYSSYFFPHNYHYEKRVTRHTEWLNDSLTNLANWIQWTKLNQNN